MLKDTNDNPITSFLEKRYSAQSADIQRKLDTIRYC